MQITELRVKNFRCLRNVVLPMAGTTVVIGENNAGKTALLQALRLALSRRWGRRGTGFSEYDFFMDEEILGPEQSSGIAIDVVFSESKSDEWSEDLTAELEDIVQTDPVTDIDSITLRAECQFDAKTQTIDSSWSFLGRDGQPLAGPARRIANLNTFFDYVPTFSLSALRDASSEFSSRSKFWGQLLKRVSIPEEEWAPIAESLEELNSELLKAEPQLGRVRSRLKEIQKIIASQEAGDIEIRALPMKAWDLIARAEVMVRSGLQKPSLPLERQGQGTQSLAVVFVFQAFVDSLLADMYRKESEPLLLLEEPEAHLHPQAARALGSQLPGLIGQKVVSTHSPQFIERIPFRAIRILRSSGEGSKVFFLQESFSCQVPWNEELRTAVAKSSGRLAYDQTSSRLSVTGSLGQAEYRELLQCFTSADHRSTAHPRLKQMYEESVVYMTDDELLRLEEWARRIRGEIFFARAWLLCEGQTEYILCHLFADIMGFSLDANGVAVIDYQNNGAPGSFAALARALGFPWIMTCDGDDQGEKAVSQVRARGFGTDELEKQVCRLPDASVEEYLFESGYEAALTEALVRLGVNDDLLKGDESVLAQLEGHKPQWAAQLAELMRGGEIKADVPAFFKEVLEAVKGQVDGRH